MGKKDGDDSDGGDALDEVVGDDERRSAQSACTDRRDALCATEFTKN